MTRAKVGQHPNEYQMVRLRYSCDTAFPADGFDVAVHLANQCAANQQRTKWVGYTRWVSRLMILAVPVWWSLCVVVNKSGTDLGFINAAPVWVLLLSPCP